MITQREIASGDILNLIDKKNRPVSITEINSYLKSDQELTYLSIDWLLHEGYARLIHEGLEVFLYKR